MSRQGSSQTHYRVLDVDPTATADEIRRSWRSLVLLYHPDKGSSAAAEGGQEREERLLEVNRAWTVLRDPAMRASYDRSVAGASSCRQQPYDRSGNSRPPPPLARTVLSLDDFEAHYDHRQSVGVREPSNEDEEEPTHYTHPCRCSALYTITTAQLEDGVDIVGCDGCGDWIRVGYEVVEDADL